MSCPVRGIGKPEAGNENPSAGSLSCPESSIQIPPKERRGCGMSVAMSHPKKDPPRGPALLSSVEAWLRSACQNGTKMHPSTVLRVSVFGGHSSRIRVQSPLRPGDVHHELQVLLRWYLEARRAGMSVAMSHPKKEPPRGPALLSPVEA